MILQALIYFHCTSNSQPIINRCFEPGGQVRNGRPEFTILVGLRDWNDVFLTAPLQVLWQCCAGNHKGEHSTGTTGWEPFSFCMLIEGRPSWDFFSLYPIFLGLVWDKGIGWWDWWLVWKPENRRGLEGLKSPEYILYSTWISQPINMEKFVGHTKDKQIVWKINVWWNWQKEITYQNAKTIRNTPDKQ